MQIINKKMKPLFEMAKMVYDDTGILESIFLSKKTSEHEARIKFDPRNGEKKSRKWPYIRVHDLKVYGEYSKKVDIDSLIQWTSDNRENINNVFYEKIDFDVFRLFLRFSRKMDDIGDFIKIPKTHSMNRTSLDIHIDTDSYFAVCKSQVCIICTKNNNKFVGIVSAEDPKQFLFIKGYERYAEEIVSWVWLNRQDVIDSSNGKKYWFSKQ
ncbi:MAG: hypothetical protein FWH18_00015 [Marinilabiliaceae bacterium]|nr:hypothetical protein [Marinilabiliaceae bacterium]